MPKKVARKAPKAIKSSAVKSAPAMYCQPVKMEYAVLALLGEAIIIFLLLAMYMKP